MGIVVHSYGARGRSDNSSKKYPRFEDAIQLIEHCAKIGAGGVQTIVRDWSDDFTKKVRDRREKLGLYLEGSIRLPISADEVAQFEKDVLSAKEAGASVLRAVCGGRRYEIMKTSEEFKDWKLKSIFSMQLAEPVVSKHQMRLAIENHKDWRATELSDVMKQLDSEWVGVTLDFGNSIALLESPIDVTNTLAPYVYSTHVKDMGVATYDKGFLLSEVPLGQGMVDLKAIVATCKKYNPKITFNLEMITRDPLEIPCLTDGYWATFGDVTGQELSRTLRMVKEKMKDKPLPTVTQLDDEGRLEIEEKNNLACLEYSRKSLGMV